MCTYHIPLKVFNSILCVVCIVLVQWQAVSLYLRQKRHRMQRKRIQSVGLIHETTIAIIPYAHTLNIQWMIMHNHFQIERHSARHVRCIIKRKKNLSNRVYIGKLHSQIYTKMKLQYDFLKFSSKNARHLQNQLEVLFKQF